MKKRVLTMIMAAVMLLSVCASLGSCSKPPEYSEIEDRFKELVEASYEINKVLFGEGLPTYERIYDPWEDMEVLEQVGEDGKRSYVYYCYMTDGQYGDILAYRSGYTSPVVYLQIMRTPVEGKTPVYVNEETGKYFYETDYVAPQIDFYYSQKDPDNYDYVTPDSTYQTVEQIKEASEKVYSKDYLENSVYLALFSGASLSDDLSGLSARYIEFSDTDMATVSFMQSNTYEPLVTETRIFDFSTATMVKPSSKKLVNIEVQTYLESKPDERTAVRVTMVLQDGQWFLDSGTY